MAVSLSGPFSLQGRQALAGLCKWVEYANGSGGVWVGERRQRCRLTPVYYDDGGQRGKSREMTERLLSRDKVDLLFGPYSSGLTVEAALVAQEYGRVLWNHGGATYEASSQARDRVVNILSPARQYFQGVWI